MCNIAYLYLEKSEIRTREFRTIIINAIRDRFFQITIKKTNRLIRRWLNIRKFELSRDRELLKILSLRGIPPSIVHRL